MFFKHLSQNPSTPTRGLLVPYLQYEAQLRRLSRKGEPGQDPWTIWYKNKYILALPKRQRPIEDELAIVPTLAGYQDSFKAFSHGVFQTLDWSNIVVAGSAALLPLLPHKSHLKVSTDKTVQSPAETYFQKTAKSSDIDLFFYGLYDDDTAMKRIREINATLRAIQGIDASLATSVRSKYAITLVSPRWPFRHVQILTGFDIDCSCVAFDGTHVYSNPRGLAAIATRTNTIDLTRRSPSYESRLIKYRYHDFEVFWPLLDRSRLRKRERMREQWEGRQPVNGLALLISSESTLRRFSNVGDPQLTPPSGYSNLLIPFGENMTAKRVRAHVDACNWRSKSKEYSFGALDEVIGKSNVTFITDDPGRQMIGSFCPLSPEDW
ncbi:hypothetical protein QBC34DRAFT_451384 [Podospora aff. communis PSN243]|uniref:Uncharacterized protein n=1 Tax=Podospora aff. communis PSN243 TaxID=3040156 RepID=A0AAV9GB01_9PEZI|nr:hypothetical protein QBC34DRAFT_451384 [Podospora aff. communis PSN243]